MSVQSLKFLIRTLKVKIKKLIYLKKIVVYYKMSESQKYPKLKYYLQKHKTIPEKTFTHTAGCTPKNLSRQLLY